MNNIEFIIILAIFAIYLLWLYLQTNKKLQQTQKQLLEYENTQKEFSFNIETLKNEKNILNKELDITKQQLDNQNLKLEELNKEFTICKTENISLIKDKEVFEEKLTKLQNLQKEYENLQIDLNQKNITIAKLQSNVEDLTSQNETLKNELSQIKERLNNIQKENIHQKENIATLLEIQNQYKTQKENLNQKEQYIKELEQIKSNLEKEVKYLETKIKESEKSFEEKMEIIQKSEEKLKISFENLANKILEETKDKMVNSSKMNLSAILNPLQHDIKDFKDKLEHIEKDNAQTIGALQNELKNLKELNIKLSDEAHNLTKALKGDKKKQGNWGELVLERVLEMSGLTKGREYEREVSLKNSDNQKYRPDVIVHLPDNRDVIIDAKTSLLAYDEYINTEEKIYIDSHIKAIKNHIDTLADKRYEKLEGVNSLDFVFMFIPIENALMLALENDTELFEYAFKKKVVLVSPTTLLVSLRAIESAWRFEKQTKNIEEIVKSAENLYDKVRGFTEDFEKIGKNLELANNSYQNAKKKLTDGRGNVIRQIELLKEKANIKPKKEIDKNLIE